MLLQKLLLQKLLLQKLLLLACRKKAAVLGAVTASPFSVLELQAYNRKRLSYNRRRPKRAKRLQEQKENVPHPLPAKRLPRDSG